MPGYLVIFYEPEDDSEIEKMKARKAYIDGMLARGVSLWSIWMDICPFAFEMRRVFWFQDRRMENLNKKKDL